MAGAHHHAHDHAQADFGRAFALGTALNLAFVVLEGGAGLWSDSVALLADAGHNFSDVIGLLIAWGGAELSKLRPSKRFTYGYSSSSILAALANALLLLVAVGAIGWEAFRRLADPPPVAGMTVILVAAAGIVVNTATALLFVRGRKGDLNVRGAFLHMVGDAAVSAGVVIGGALILWTGTRWIDPVASLLIVAVILWSTWGLLRESIAMALHAVPREIDALHVEAMLAALPGVSRVHDLHIWPVSTRETAMTAHLVMPGGHPGDEFLIDLQHELDHDFAIGHATVQIEIADGAECRMHGNNGNHHNHDSHGARHG